MKQLHIITTEMIMNDIQQACALFIRKVLTFLQEPTGTNLNPGLSVSWSSSLVLFS